MSRQIQLRRGTATQNNNFTGAEGEVTFDTDAKTLRVHDGQTPGGTALAKQSDVDNMANIAMDNLSATGKKVVANLGMPSSNYIDLTLQQSGATYTAPADGYFQLSIVAGVANTYMFMENTSNGLRADGLGSQTYQTLSGTVPVSKGQKVRITYNASGNITFFRFVYINAGV